MSLTHGSLFSGIGGFDLAAEWAGWENMFHCELNPFGRRVLHYYWPNATTYEDITKADFSIWRGRIDVITGGFPCQDISIAGHKKGLKGERSGLFYEYIRAINECKPRVSVWENVGEVRRYLPAIIESFAKIGYSLQWMPIRASWLGFPHSRERIFGIAYNSDCFGWEQIQVQAGIIEKAISEASRRESCGTTGRKIQLEDYPKFLRMDDGLSRELASESVKAYGNAIVPQVAFQIFQAINQYQAINR